MIRLVIIFFFIFNLLFNTELKALNFQLIHLNSGWNLKGTYLDNVSINQFNNNYIKTIWKWKNNNWSMWSPNKNIIKLINKIGINVIKFINSGEGFWINTAKSTIISVSGNISNNKILKIPSLGWYLVSSKINSNNKFNIFKNFPIKTIWKWDNSSWKIWSKYDNLINLIKFYGLKLANNFTAEDGFWINSENGFIYNFSKCSQDNLSACTTEDECKNNGGIWNDNKCIKQKPPIKIYIFNDNLSLLKGVVLENLTNKNFIFSSNGIISLTKYLKSSKYIIKKVGYGNCTINLSNVYKKNECYITDGSNYVVFLHNNLIDNKTLGFPIPYIKDFSPAKLLKSLLIPATPVKKPFISYKKNAVLIVNKINTKQDYTISINAISNPKIDNFKKGIPLYFFSINIEDVNKNTVKNIDGSIEVKPIVKVDNESDFKNVFLYQKNSNGKWKYVCPVIFKNNMLIPLFYVENLSDFLFVKFDAKDLIKLEGKVKDAKNNYINKAIVLTNNSIVTFTDNNGNFIIKTPESVKYLTICKEGFICSKINDYINGDDIILLKENNKVDNFKIDFYGSTNKAVFSYAQNVDDKIVFSSIDGNIYSLSNKNLKKDFNKFKGYLYTEFNKFNNNYIIGITLKGNLEIFNILSNEEKYKISLNEDLFFGEENYFIDNIIIYNNIIYVPFYNENNNFSRIIEFKYSFENNDLYLLKISNKFIGKIGQLNRLFDKIAFGGDNGSIKFINCNNLSIIKTFQNETKITAKVLEFGNYYITGDWNGNIIKINKDLSKFNKIKIGKFKIYNITLINSFQIALSTNNGVYIVDKDFKIVKHLSKKLVNGRVYYINGNYIFATIDGEVYKNSIPIINVGNKIIFYKIVDNKLIIFSILGEVFQFDVNLFF